jgi:hypothetical protein
VNTVAVSAIRELADDGSEGGMQTVQLFDGVRDHGFTIPDIAPGDGRFEVVVQGDVDGQQHRLSVHPDSDGSFRVTHRSSPAVQVAVVNDRYAEQIEVRWAADAGDVSGPANDPVLQLTGTVTEDDDVTGHLSDGQLDSGVVLAASGAYMLIRQLAASDAAQHGNG